MKRLQLKKGKEKPILSRHHWIFSGAVQKTIELEPGELVHIYSADNVLLGTAYTNPKGSLLARMVAFGDTPYEVAIEEALLDAIALRKQFFNTDKTSAYRLINGEGDRLPGLIVDQYDHTLVLQIGTAGMDRLKSLIVQLLLKHVPNCKCIYEKSDLNTRLQEGLKKVEGPLHGQLHSPLIIKENGHLFEIDIEHGQKTGFFLDQREMRQFVGELSTHRSVLNCFCYSGGFSIYALKHHAKSVRSVDLSDKAMALTEKNCALNGFNLSRDAFVCADVFDFLKKDPLEEDIVILDPPAFAKKKEDVNNACRGYKEINRQALLKMKKGSILITASCSYHVDADLFQQVIFQAAFEAKRKVKLLSKHRAAFDHPINLFHPEGDYLKSLVLYVE